MAASPYCLYALAFILIRSASALIGALSAQQAILPQLQNLPTASVALASAAPIRRIFSPSALAASTVLVLQDNGTVHQVGKEICSGHQKRWFLPLSLGNCLHLVAFRFSREFHLGSNLECVTITILVKPCPVKTKLQCLTSS